MNPVIRNRLAAFLAGFRPRVLPSSRDSTTTEIEALSSVGIARLGQVLTKAQCDELVIHFRRCAVYDPYRSDGKRFLPDSADRNSESHTAHHLPQDVLKAPYLLEIANSSRVLDIVSGFLRCKPTIAYLAAWWSYHTPKGAQQAEFFHRDVDDWKFAKLFVYLTDVSPTNGPHVYVRTSSSSRLLAEIRRFDDQEVREAFGEENILQMSAPAGYAFLEDTFGIHKGHPVDSGTRLVFQAVYALSTIPYGPRATVMTRDELAIDGLDPWINRIYLR